MYDKELTDILNKLITFDKMYEIIRLVDPVAKKVMNYKDSNLDELELECFDIWGKNKICDNCISIRAYSENKTFVKIEYSAGKIFMVTAMPIELNHRRIVIELLKDITNSMLVDHGEHTNSTEIYAMIDGINKQALKDPLTGIYNRRFINEKLPIDLISTELSNQSISLIMADIDFFKKVNDTYGHLAGDEVIKRFAELISEFVKRENDWVSRFGGEEFLICLPGAPLEKALEIAEIMRAKTENNDIRYNDSKIKITASFGVCSIKPDKGSRIEDFIECADRSLYKAKNNGRNRVEA